MLEQAFDVHAPSLNINQNLLIEASAGTGKTYTIEQLFLRRLTEPFHGNAVEPSSIAVVTFTRAAARELEERIRAASNHPRLDEALIATIHSFANQLLAQFFGARTSQFVGEEELKGIILDYFLVEDPEIMPEEVSQLLIKHGMSEKKLAESLAGDLYKWKSKQSLQVIFTELEQAAKKTGWSEEYVLAGLDALSLHFTGLRDKFKNLSGEAEVAFRAFAKLFSEASQKEKITALFKAPFFPQELFQKPKVKAQFDGAFLEILQKDFGVLLEEAFDCEQVMRRLTLRVEKFVTARLKKLNCFTPDSLMNEFEEALDNPAFLAFARSRFVAVFIDEFQDTDPQQWKIFSTLFLDPAYKGYLYLVGDPKQAIYSFRKADVYSYIAAKEHFPAENQATLLTNFRSSKQLIAATNKLFQTGKSAILLPKLEKKVLAIQPVQAGRDIPELPQGAPIHFIEVHDELGRKRNWPHEQAEEKFFAAIADEIIELKLPLSSFAILVTDRFQGERCRLFLERYGVRAVTHRSTSLKETPAYQFLKHFLLVLEQPKKRASLLTLLASPPLLFHERELQKIAEDLEEWARYVQLFRSMSSNIGAAIQHLLAHFPIADAEFLRDLGQLVEHLQEQRQKDPQKVLAALSSEEEVRFEPHDSAVSIMTVFKSKGLEFDVVFALQLCVRSRKVDEEQEAEKMRQLYVAATRAKRRLYLPVLVETTGKAAEEGTASPMEKFLQDVSLTEFLKDGTLFSSRAQESNIPQNMLKAHDIVIPEEKIYAPFEAQRLFLDSFSRHKKEYVRQQQSEETLPRGPQTGIVLHRLIATLKNPIIEPAWLEKELYGTILAPYREEVSLILERLLSTSFGTFTLRDIDFTRVFREMEFAYTEKDGHMMRGIIDFAFEHEGTFYLIDFKSGKVEDGAYSEQARIYCNAFCRYLKSMNIPEERLAGFYFIYLRTGEVQRWKP